MSERPWRDDPNIDCHFPAEAICPVCGTNDDGRCVLIPIVEGQKGSLVEAAPMHLACVASVWYARSLRCIAITVQHVGAEREAAERRAKR